MKNILIQLPQYFFLKGAIMMLLCFSAPLAYAAQLTIELPDQGIGFGSDFIATVLLDTQHETLNAFEGQLTFSTDILEIKEIRDGNSLVTLWLDAPKAHEDTILFSGVTPSGYQGSRGTLFSIVFHSKKEGEGLFAWRNVQTFKNDGQGTPVATQSSSRTFSVSQNFPASLVMEVLDVTPPESFAITMTQSSYAFEGKNVLVFDAQDKHSGIDHYEVCEGLFAACLYAESPYALVDQSGGIFITVKAFDRAGNMRAAYLLSDSAMVRYAFRGILAILLCVSFVFLFARLRRTHLP